MGCYSDGRVFSMRWYPREDSNALARKNDASDCCAALICYARQFGPE